jgi:Putative transposase
MLWQVSRSIRHDRSIRQTRRGFSGSSLNPGAVERDPDLPALCAGYAGPVRPQLGFAVGTVRGKFVDGLRKLHAEHKLGFYGTLATLANPKAFAAWLRPLFRSKWVVYSKRPFGGARHALCYLGQYTHRVAISNHRLVALADGIVTFRWRDSAHKNKKHLMTLGVDEFLRRFLLHVLPPGFVRIRHFGLLAHRRRGALLPLCVQLLAESGRVPADAGPKENTGSSPRPLWTCPQCGGPMVLIERLSSVELRLRSPPVPAAQQP